MRLRPSIKIMGKNLTGKLAFIVAVLVIFVFGIVGIPHGSLKQSITDRIKLGLDLKGGTHLVLEVHVAEAVVSATDRDAARIEADFVKAGVNGASVGKTDPARPQTIVISGIPAGKLSDARSVLKGNDYSIYDVSSEGNGNSTLTMKQAALRDLETRTVDTSIETIRERIDKLGVSEPVIQKYGLGENQILVELPGIDNPAQVEEVIQSTAKLAIHAVVGGPFATDQEALQASCGCSADEGFGFGGCSGAGVVAEACERGGRHRLPRCTAFSGPERPSKYYVYADHGGGRPLLQIHPGASGFGRYAGVDGDCAG
jgi:preprotein translocase subunit SecD